MPNGTTFVFRNKQQKRTDNNPVCYNKKNPKTSINIIKNYRSQIPSISADVVSFIQMN